MRKAFRLWLFILTVMMLWGCAPNPDKMPGEYVFKWKSGEVEYIALHEDRTYFHALYRDTDAFKNRKEIHSSKGRFSFKKPTPDDVCVKITFEGTYYDYEKEYGVLSYSPTRVFEQPAFWDVVDGFCILEFSVDGSYVFIKGRESLERFLWNK